MERTRSKLAISLLALQALFAMVFFVACSDNKVAGGNSSEVGSPELMGTLAYDDGTSNPIYLRRAAYARVYCVPVDYDPAKDDSTAYYSTTADSMGHYEFDHVPDGLYNIEAFYEDSEKSFALRESGVKIANESTLSMNLDIPKSHEIRVRFSDVKDSVASISIVGSTYKSTAKITTDEYGQYVTFEGLPAAYYDSVQVSTNSGALSLKAVFVDAYNAFQNVFYDDTVRTLEIPLNTAAGGIDLHDTLEGFPLYVRLSDLNAQDRKSLAKNLNELKVFLEPAADWTTSQTVYDKDGNPVGLWIHLTTLYPQRELQKLVFSWTEYETVSEVDATSAETAATLAAPSKVNAQKPMKLKRAAEPFSDDFVAAWNFDETELDSTTRSSGNNPFKGRVTDVATGDGIIGGAFYFNGKSSIIEIENSADYWGFALADTSHFSASFWVNVEDTSTSRFVWGKSESEYHFKYQAGDSDKSSWMFKELDESDLDHWYEASIATKPAVDYNQWVHFTVVKSGDSTAIYRNGVLEDVQVGRNHTDDKRIADGPFVIGARKQSSGKVDRVFKGWIDELYFLNAAKSSEWARLIYLNQKPSGYWPK
jgi:hypothetical protein